MNSELNKEGFSFDSVWDRMVQVTGWKNQGQLAEFLGITSASVSGAKGRGFISLEWIFKVARAFNVYTDWLATGEGPIKRGEPPVVAEPPLVYCVTDEELKNEYVLVPRYNVKASAGGGAIIESEQIVDLLAFKARWIHSMHWNPANLLLINTIGDSMYPTIEAGDLLLVDKGQREVRDDAIYILQIDGTLVAKRLQKLYDGSIQIKSDNQVYDAQLVPVDRVNMLNIIGRVVWGGGRM